MSTPAMAGDHPATSVAGSVQAGTAAAHYHERQRLQRCGLHAVNNLVQRRAFTAREFDRIADEIPSVRGRCCEWCHPPYRSALPQVGNYDLSVLVVALCRLGLEAQQHDARQP